MPSLLQLLALPVEIESTRLQGLSQAVSSAFTRETTLVFLSGGGHEGVGEDVTYEAGAQRSFQALGPRDLSGTYTLDSFSAACEGFSPYRRWAFESAALDLALLQAETSLAEAAGRSPAPVRFVVSTRLDGRGVAPLRALVEREPSIRFKLDPTSDWDDAIFTELVELDRVDVVDLKGAYRGTVVDQPADARLYARVAEAFPSAWIEDPDLHDPAAAAVLEPHRERITWDAVIHSVADVDALAFPPRTLNVKPSRFGSLRRLLEFYEACAERGIGLYGGGQFELGPGRGQIQYLASLFHPDSCNDVAPGGYNDPSPAPGLPGSPLAPVPALTGFRWDGLQDDPSRRTV